MLNRNLIHDCACVSGLLQLGQTVLVRFVFFVSRVVANRFSIVLLASKPSQITSTPECTIRKIELGGFVSIGSALKTVGQVGSNHCYRFKWAKPLQNKLTTQSIFY